ncbi:MAG: radical SAM family heme chaperone HemW [Armatimonadetes bacterium]|nr:radical SAM family heme chaperone HemW [Armatimonadota bacterium]
MFSPLLLIASDRAAAWHIRLFDVLTLDVSSYEETLTNADTMTVSVMNAPTSAYIHIPFCAAKCGYCDFNSYAGLMPLADRYVEALCRHIETANAHLRAPLKTVFFGGGTPSILQARHLERILHCLRQTFGLDPDAEVTLEANPESATFQKLCKTREAGFNRISIGAQSFDDSVLESLGRVHTHQRFLSALADARRAGYANISFDLMFALPGQTLQNVLETVRQAIQLAPEHISAYCLTVEEGTDFHRLHRLGKLELPDEDLQAEMFLSIQSALTQANFEHYEISNYARPGFRCRHNEVYWRNEPYWGFGTGAVGYVQGQRTKWEINPRDYIEQIEQAGQPRVEESEKLEGRALLGETIMLALRTAEGIDLDSVSQRFGTDVAACYSGEIQRFSAAGVLQRSGSTLCLTKDGLLLANEILCEFL